MRGFAALGPYCFDWFGGPGGPSGYGGYWFFGMMLLRGLFYVAVAILIYKLIKSYTGNAKQNRSSEDALEILNQRLARGEIDEDEYKRKREILNK